MITERSLGKAGQEYMHEILCQGGGLAERVATSVSKSGELFAPLPLGVSARRALDFDSGGMCDSQFSQGWLFDDLQNKSEGNFIVQDIWAKRSDLLVKPPEYESYFFYGDGVYYFIDLASLKFSEFLALGRQVSSFQFAAFYTTAVINEKCLDAHEMKTECLDVLAAGVRSIYVSAYDRESYIVWRPA